MNVAKQRVQSVTGWCVVLMVAIALCSFMATSGYSQDKPYEPTWESLRKHPVPQWLKDGKFGLWTHWGPYAVTGKHIWYPRRVYKNPDFQEFHENTYGPLEEVGYHDLIPKFTAEKFDAEEWARLFKRGGARFAGPIAEHHDGFAMWDTEYTRWNSVEMGPKRDIHAELAKSIRGQGMKFVTSFHHLRKWWFFESSYTSDDRYNTKDPRYAGLGNLYPQPHRKNEKAPESYFRMSMGKVREVIDKYQPSLLFFDSGPFSKMHDNGNWFRAEDYNPRFRKMIAYYYNQARKWGEEVAIVTEIEDLPGDDIRDVGVETYERKKLDSIPNISWIMLASAGNDGWSYQRKVDYKSSRELVHLLVDVVSKNGILWLNLGPKADGTIPEPQKKRVLEIGNWLRQNGEAIYGTRPWKTFGEDGFDDPELRFTRSKDGHTLYVIALDWPGDTLTPRNLLVQNDADGTIRLLGHEDNLEYAVANGQLRMEVPDLSPDERPNKYAYVFKLSGFGEIQLASDNPSISRGKPAKASNVYKNQVADHGPSKAVDGDLDTRWATDVELSDPWIQIDLQEPTTINRIRVHEALGKWVQSHSLECWADGEWKTIYKGDTIGSNFERTFDPVTTSKVRLNVHEAKKGPTIREILLFGPDG